MSIKLRHVMAGLLFLAVASLVLNDLFAQSRPATAPAPKSGAMLDDVLAARRSTRHLKDQAIAQEQILKLCWAAQGVTDPKTGKRTAPSAGATYPLELLVCTAGCTFHYLPADNKLEKLSDKDLRPALKAATNGQAAVGVAPAVFVFTGVPARTAVKYGDRAERFLFIESGHACQNLLLEATALGLASVPVGAGDDAALTKALDLPKGQVPLYMAVAGMADAPTSR